MVAVGLAAVLGLVVSQMVVFGIQGAQGVTSSIAFDSLMSKIRIMMKSDSVCQSSLSGVALVPLTGTQQVGDPGSGAVIPTLFQLTPGPNTSTLGPIIPFISSGQSYRTINNLNILLYDFGAIDSVPPVSSVHLVGIYIGGSKSQGSKGGPANMHSMLYPSFAITLDGKTVSSCSWSGYIQGMSQSVSVAGTGTNILGLWIINRYGDLITNPKPRPGTYDVAHGSGAVTGVGPVIINAPSTFGAWAPVPNGNFVSNITSKSWQETAYKLW